MEEGKAARILEEAEEEAEEERKMQRTWSTRPRICPPAARAPTQFVAARRGGPTVSRLRWTISALRENEKRRTVNVLVGPGLEVFHFLVPLVGASFEFVHTLGEPVKQRKGVQRELDGRKKREKDVTHSALTFSRALSFHSISLS